MERDNLHFTFRTIDGYNKPFNIVISCREAGKTTAAWLDKAYKAFLEGKTTIIIRRLIADITDVYINDIGEVINKFIEEPIVLDFKKGSIKDGVVDVKINGKLFVRVIALSNPMSRIKSLIVRNLKYIIFDEFICNTKLGEKYLPNEAFKFKELFNTFQRENPELKTYFLGNPYSVVNPYTIWLGAEFSKIEPGVILTGQTWVLQAYEISNKLRKQILKRNPLYQFDDSYTSYAFGGMAINDKTFRIDPVQPEGFKLWKVLTFEGSFIGIYKANEIKQDYAYWCNKIEEFSDKRTALCFDINELVNRTAMITQLDQIELQYFKNCVGNRWVVYGTIDVAYILHELYSLM